MLIFLMELKHLKFHLKKVIPIFLIFRIQRSAHPFAFSDGIDGSGSSFTNNVTNDGNTVEITIDDTTPNLYYYLHSIQAWDPQLKFGGGKVKMFHL